jgi:hypothetical protein
MVNVKQESIPLNVAFKVLNSICKIKIKYDGMESIITGFFIKINSLKYLMTNCQHIKIESIKNVIIEIWNKKTMNLSVNGRFIKYYKEPKNIIVFEIKESDCIYNDIQFLDYDHEIINKTDYSVYKNQNIFTVVYINEEEETCETGKIIDIDNYEFIHNIKVSNFSSGSPIILWSKNINEIKVIGIYTKGDFFNNMNFAIFIDIIIKDLININKDSINKKINSDKEKICNINLNNNSQKENKLIEFPIIIKENSPNNQIFKKSTNMIINQKALLNDKISNENNNISNNINLSQNESQSLNANSINDITSNSSSINLNKKEKNISVLKQEKIIVLKFISSDQCLNYSIVCKSTDKFNLVINRIFDIYPEYIEKKCFFMCNGNVINEYKDIQENKIKNGDTILVNTLE